MKWNPRIIEPREGRWNWWGIIEKEELEKWVLDLTCWDSSAPALIGFLNTAAAAVGDRERAERRRPATLNILVVRVYITFVSLSSPKSWGGLYGWSNGIHSCDLRAADSWVIASALIHNTGSIRPGFFYYSLLSFFEIIIFFLFLLVNGTIFTCTKNKRKKLN